MTQTCRIGTVATTVRRRPHETTVTYHDTDVVTVYPNGKIVLDSGGWRTATTRTRMNQASHELHLGFEVYQRNFNWYVAIDGHVLDFTDGIVIRNGSDF